MLKRWILGCSILCFAFVANANEKISHFTLDNGLNVYVKEDHRAPVAVFQIWYKVGSVDENPGYTGISHVLEHMMFKGTDSHPEGVFNKMIVEHGGSQNAGTSNDFTYYYQILDKKHLELSFQLESDRMLNLKFNFDDFKKELEVVKEERRLRTDSRPTGILWERFTAAAHVASPYHYPVIGWMHEIEQLTAADIRKWYDEWYTPNNANIIVVGDVQPEDVKNLATKYFNDIPRRALPVKKRFQEIQALGERRIQVNLPAEVPSLLMGYNTPVATQDDKDWEAYALDIAAEILSGGRSSRLQKDLVRDKQIVTSISVNHDLLARLPGLFTIAATPSANKTTKEVEDAITAHIAQLQKTPVTTEELRRVKRQVMADKIFSQDSISGQASLLGNIVTVGLPWQLYNNYVDKLAQVTAQQVQEVAQKYLIAERLTVATLIPKQGA